MLPFCCFELLHYSDRGSQYTSPQCQRLMAGHGAPYHLPPMGNDRDNAAISSVLSMLKTERTAGKIYRPRDQVSRPESRRRHSTIGYLSPVDFETLMRLA